MKRLRTRTILVDRYSSNRLGSVEDHQSEDINLVGLYRDMATASNALPACRPEIIVAAFYQNDVESLQYLRKIRNLNPSIKFFVLCDATDSSFIFEVMSIGVGGIIDVETPWQKVLVHLQNLINGQAPISPTASKLILESFRLNLVPELTRRQLEILRLMFLGLTYSSIAARLGISQETSRTHMKNIYRKLSVNSREEALKKAVDEKMILFKF